MHLAEEAYGGSFIFTTLGQDVDDVAVLIRGTPERAAFALHRDDPPSPPCECQNFNAEKPGNMSLRASCVMLEDSPRAFIQERFRMVYSQCP